MLQAVLLHIEPTKAALCTGCKLALTPANGALFEVSAALEGLFPARRP